MRHLSAFILCAFVAPMVASAQAPRTSSATVVDSTRLLPSAARSIVEGLAGKVPGVRILTPSGRPGVAPWITVRNAGMNTETQPLVVVDGVVRRFGIDDLTMEDVERVEVLKGAAAGALYGIGAANGVLLITTRQRATRELSLRLRTEFGVTVPRAIRGMSLRHPFQLNADSSGFLLDGAGRRLLEPGRLALNPYPAYHQPVHDFIGNRTALANHLSAGLQVAGTSILVAMHSERDDGILRSVTALNRRSARLSVAGSVWRRFHFSGRAFASGTSDDALDDLDAQFGGLPFIEPNANPDSVSTTCTFVTPPCYPGLPIGGTGVISDPAQIVLRYEHPFERSRHFSQAYDDTRWNAGASVSFAARTWLTADARIATDRVRGSNTMRETFGWGSGVVDTGRVSASAVGATATRTLLSGRVTTRVRAEYSYERRKLTRAAVDTGGQFIVTDIFTGTVDTNYAMSSSYSLHSATDNAVTVSASAEIGEKWAVDAGLRREVLREYIPWRSIPGFVRIAGAYRPRNWITLRAARGNSVFTPDVGISFAAPFFPGPQDPPTAGPLALNASEHEFGADFRVLGSRLTYTFARQETRDLLMFVPLPASIGFVNAWRNALDVKGKSHEAALVMPTMRRGPLSWEVSISAHRGRARFGEMNVPSVFQTMSPTGLLYLTERGRTIGTFWGTKLIRTVEQLEETIKSGNLTGPASNYMVNEDGFYVRTNAYGGENEVPLPAWECINRDTTGTCTQWTSASQIGDQNSTFDFGADGRVRFGPISASVVLSGAVGGDWYNTTRASAFRNGRAPEVDQTGKSPLAAKPVTYYQAIAGFGFASPAIDYFVESGTFVNVRSVTLEWTSPDLRALKFTGFSGMAVGVTARNPWVSRSYAGFEPDAGSATPNLWDFRVARLTYPSYRTFSATVTLTR